MSTSDSDEEFNQFLANTDPNNVVEDFRVYKTHLLLEVSFGFKCQF